MRAPAILALCFGLVLPFAVAARPPQASATVSEIHVTGSHRYDDAQIAAAAGLKPGDPVTRDTLQAAAERLLKTGVFERVNYHYTSQGDKVSVEFELTDAPSVPVSFDNFPWFTDEQISDAIRQVEPLFDGTAPTQGSVLDDMDAAIAKLLAEKNISGTVQHMLMQQPVADGSMVQFSLSGPPVTIASLDYGDSLAQTSEQLKDRNTDLVGKPFSRFGIEVFENEQVRPVYLSSGHLRVKFGTPVVHFAENAASANASAVQVSIPIDPGPVYKLSGVKWDGVTIVSDVVLKDVLQVQPDQIADGMRLAGSWQRLEDEYARRGYLDMKLDAQPQYDDNAGTVSYHVAVKEGAQYRMGSLIITGLSVDAEKIVRAFWRIPTGNVFDRTYFDELLEKVERPTPEVFGELPVHYTKTGHWLRTDPDKHIVDVLLDFQ